MSQALRVEWIETLEEVESLRDAWTSLEAATPSRTVFCTFDWVLPWYQGYYAGRGTPLVGVARDGREVVGVAPLVYSRATLGKVPVRRVDFAGHTTGAGEFLVPQDRPRVVAAMVDSLLSRGGFDAVSLNGVDPDSVEFARVRETSASHRLRLELSGYRYAVVDLSRGYEAYCRAMTQNFRRNQKRQAQRLAEAGALHIDRLRGVASDDVAAAYVGRMFAIDDASWKARERGPMAAHFRRFYGEVTHRFARRGMADVAILSVGGTDAAVILGVVERGVYYDVTVAYGAAFEKLSPGSYLLQEVLRESAASGIHTLVSHGDHEYKSRWASGFVPQTRAILFAPSWRGALSRVSTLKGPRVLETLQACARQAVRVWDRARGRLAARGGDVRAGEGRAAGLTRRP